MRSTEAKPRELVHDYRRFHFHRMQTAFTAISSRKNKIPSQSIPLTRLEEETQFTPYSFFNSPQSVMATVFLPITMEYYKYIG